MVISSHAGDMIALPEQHHFLGRVIACELPRKRVIARFRFIRSTAK